MTDQAKIHSLKRPAIERMLRIHQELKSDRLPNCTTLAREMEVSSKTISRDIDFMRDRMLLPIEYESSKHGYYYTRDVESLPTIDISEGELLALSIAQKAMDHYKGTPFERPLSNALNKLAASLPDTITANLSELSDTISFRQSRQSYIDENLLQIFTKSALEKTEIVFLYKKLGAKEAEERRFWPYHLTNFLGKWYAIGWDIKRDAMRTFLLSRASHARSVSKRFKIPSTFSADDYLGSSFGIYSPSGSHTIKLRFDPPLSEYISENIWHPSQSVSYQSDGAIEICFKLNGLQEIASWILGWGPQVKVLEPIQLRKLIVSEAKEIVKQYR